MNKIEIRTKMIEKRSALLKDEVLSLSQKVQEFLFDLPQVESSSCIMAYMAFKNEISTIEIIERLLLMGKQVLLPYVVPKERLIIPALVEDINRDLVEGAYGILEPNPDNLKEIDASKIDIVLVPGLAFDMNGNRLGYGGGYYDRFLVKCKEDAVFIALAYNFQILKDLSQVTEVHDQRVHYIVTEGKVIDCNK